MASWQDGVIVSDSPDRIPATASPRARNTAFLNFGMPAKRKGTSIITPVGDTDTPLILATGQWDALQWTIGDNGSWSKVDGDAFSPIDASDATPFTDTDGIPSTAVANGLLFAVNGTDAFKTDGTNVFMFGMEAPDAPTLSAGAAGNPDGTYRVALTAYNADTGHESSLSDYDELVVTADRITVNWTFPSDPQVTHVRLHIFKEGLTDRFFQLGSDGVSVAPDSTHGGYEDSTTSVSLNITDAEINLLTIASPSTTENNPPPAGIKAIKFHGSRMFAVDADNLYFSKIGKPEAFDPRNYEPINPGDGQECVNLGTLSDEHLVIFKDRSSYQLIGPDDPNVWEVSEVDTTIGLKSSRSLLETEGALWWVSEHGFMRMLAGEKPKRLDAPALSNKFETLESTSLNMAVTAYDSLRQRVLFAVPSDGSSRNDIILPYNVKLNIWEDQWDPMDVGTLGVWYESSAGAPYVVIGNEKGRMFRVWDNPYADGVRLTDGSGNNFTLTGNPTAATANSLTDSGATFDTDDDGLDQIPVIVVSENGTVQRNIITSNTGTVLTLRDNWSVTPDASWTYYIGTINWEFDTKYLAPTSAPFGGSVFNSRRFKRSMLKAYSVVGGATLSVWAILDHNDTDLQAEQTYPLEGEGALFDIDLFDSGVFGSGRAISQHRTIAKEGRVCGLRIINREHGVGAILLSVGLFGTELSYKN